MKLLFKTIAIVLTCTTLQACSGGMNKQGAGTLIGGVAGGLFAQQIQFINPSSFDILKSWYFYSNIFELPFHG